MINSLNVLVCLLLRLFGCLTEYLYDAGYFGLSWQEAIQMVGQVSCWFCVLFVARLLESCLGDSGPSVVGLVLESVSCRIQNMPKHR